MFDPPVGTVAHPGSGSAGTRLGRRSRVQGGETGRRLAGRPGGCAICLGKLGTGMISVRPCRSVVLNEVTFMQALMTKSVASMCWATVTISTLQHQQ